MPQHSTDLAQLFWQRYYPLRLTGRSPSTIHQHAAALRHFCRFLGRPAAIADLNDLTFAQFLGWLARDRAAITANKTADKLLAEWRFYAARGLTPHWPTVSKLPEPEKIPVAWTRAEVKRLLATCRQEPGEIAGVKAADWWLALHFVLYDTAERIGAVMSVRFGDLDLAGRWLHLRAETRKGGRRSRMVRLHPDTAKQLRRIAKPARELVFPWPRDRSLLWVDYGRILACAGLPNDRTAKFHRMRKTVASYYQRAGGDATELLDHTSRRVTQAYLDPRIVRVPQPCDLLRRI